MAKTKANVKSQEYQEYEVVSGIPVPAPRAPLSSCPYPFDAMKAGDSFFVPGATHKTLANWLNRYRAKNRNKTLVSRLMDKGLRIWRTK